MKKTMFLIAAASIMAAAVSCQKDQAVEKESNIASKEILTVTADIAQFTSAATKTSIKGSASSPQPVWSAGDEIKLFNTAGGSAIYTISKGAGESSATFALKNGQTALSGDFACAYYPAENATSYTEGTGITATIPATQAYTSAVSGDSGTNAGTFAVGSFPMVGIDDDGELDYKTGNLNLTFKNVFGLLQLNFTGSETIKQIDLIGSANLSGTATITAEDDPSCSFTEGQKYVTLTSVNQTLEASNSKAFYIAVPVGTISEIYITTTTDLQSVTKSIEITRSNITSKTSATLSGAGFSAVTYSEAPNDAPVIVAGIVWAPVNCGYTTSLTYGKLYQFGRKVGTTYGNSWSSPSNHDAESNSQSYSTNPSTTTAPDDDKFYRGDNSNHDWYAGGTLSSWPMKDGDAGYSSGKIDNPCPDGWRVPTYDELNALYGNNNQLGWTTDVSGQNGYYFNGTNSCSSTTEGSKVFLPAAGGYDYNSGNAGNRGSYGLYWSSYNAGFLTFHSGYAGIGNSLRAYGYSVRCVQE